MCYTIRDALLADTFILVNIIRTSFKDVADRFCLTEHNCPKHPSNCAPQWVEEALRKGVRYFVLECGGALCGCVALEQAQPEVCYLERLAVLPECRRRGFGRALVEHAVLHAQSAGAYRVEIGIIAAQRELKAWYEAAGFAETGMGVFKHLPFEVRFMALGLADAG